MAIYGPAQYRDLVDSVRTAAASLTPGALTANVVNTSNTITVPGAAVGDIVEMVAPASLGAIIMSGEVTSANTVTVKFLSNAVTAPATGVYVAICKRLTGLALV